jgi:hypothetical protein
MRRSSPNEAEDRGDDTRNKSGRIEEMTHGTSYGGRRLFAYHARFYHDPEVDIHFSVKFFIDVVSALPSPV